MFRIWRYHDFWYRYRLVVISWDSSNLLMDATQLGRRNLHPDDKMKLIGRIYNRAKKAITNPEGIGGKSGKIDGGQNVHQQKTAETIAAKYGLSERTGRLRQGSRFKCDPFDDSAILRRPLGRNCAG